MDNEHPKFGKDDIVRTDKDPHVVSTGIVVSVSQCGRYIKVEKTYGTRSRWQKVYEASSLTLLKKAQAAA